MFSNTLAMTGFNRLWFGGWMRVETSIPYHKIKTALSLDSTVFIRFLTVCQFGVVWGKAILSFFGVTSMSPIMTNCYIYLITEHEKL